MHIDLLLRNLYVNHNQGMPGFTNCAGEFIRNGRISSFFVRNLETP